MDFSLIHSALVFFVVLFGEIFGCIFGGGGFFIQPALLVAGIPAKMAVASDIAAAGFASLGFLLMTRNHSRQIRQTAFYMAPTLILGAFTGGHILKTIPEHLVEFLVLIICASGFIYVITHFRKKRDIPAATERTPVTLWKMALVAAGMLLGFYDGVSGAGGGIITIATLSMIMRKDMKTTISMANFVSATSLLTAGLTFLYLGLLDLKLLALMVPAAFLAGSFAARISDVLPERLLRGVYAVVLAALLLYLAGGMLQDYGLLPL